LSKEFIDVSPVEERIVVCPRCGQRNRLRSQEKGAGYRCGACKRDLPNPFANAARRAYVESFGSALRSWCASGRRYRAVLVVVVALVLVACAAFFFFSNRGRQRYQYASQLPSPPDITAVLPGGGIHSLPNGTTLTGFTLFGKGSLTINNETRHDAIVKVVDEGAQQTVVAFYVSAGRSAALDRIPDGNYRIFFATGKDWDSKTGSFKLDKSYAKFDRAFLFATTVHPAVVGATMEPATFSLTLPREVRVNDQITSVKEEEFLKY
jgi:hypothetical protein